MTGSAIFDINITIEDAPVVTSQKSGSRKKLSSSQVSELFASAQNQEPTPIVVPTTLPVSQPTCTLTLTRLITQGTRGTDVQEIQTCIQSLGYNVGPLDGIYGPLTYLSIIQYQQSQGLQYIDGIVGPETLAALNALSN